MPGFRPCVEGDRGVGLESREAGADLRILGSQAQLNDVVILLRNRFLADNLPHSEATM